MEKTIDVKIDEIIKSSLNLISNKIEVAFDLDEMIYKLGIIKASDVKATSKIKQRRLIGTDCLLTRKEKNNT